MTRIVLLFLSIPLCMLGCSLFSGIEAGMLSLNRARLIHWVKRGIKPARLLMTYINDMQGFLSTILVGNNLVNVTLSTLSASLAHRLFAGSARAGTWQSLWAAAMALSILYFCEYLPKLLFRRRPLRRTVQACKVFYYADLALRPLTRLVIFVTQWLMPDKGEDAEHNRFMMTREYLENVVSDRRRGADISAFESIMIRRVLALQTVRASAIMTPMARVAKVREDAPLRQCFNLVRETGHVRIPVVSRDGHRCVGVLNVLNELIADADPDKTRAGSCKQTAFFVRDKEPADNLLCIMRRRHTRVLFVEHFKTHKVLGIVTEETIMKILTSSRVSA